MKNVYIAENAGYCFGVKRAMNMAWSELEEKKGEKKVYALGPLIHNRQAVSKYEEHGLVTVDNLDDVDNRNSEVIIRSHGVSKDVYDEAENKNLEIVDTTCPFVKKIHTLVNKAYSEGKKIIVIGDKNHPEVIGINGWCYNSAIIVKDIDELKMIKLSKDDSYEVVAQTTMNEQKFGEIIEYLNSLNLDLKIDNTICSATRERQLSARNLSEKVDVMVVIGGKHSSNTQKLVKICKEKVKTYSIETKEDLFGISFDDFEDIGVTAGASTPDWIIEDVVSYLRSI